MCDQNYLRFMTSLSTGIPFTFDTRSFRAASREGGGTSHLVHVSQRSVTLGSLSVALSLLIRKTERDCLAGA